MTKLILHNYTSGKCDFQDEADMVFVFSSFMYALYTSVNALDGN